MIDGYVLRRAMNEFKSIVINKNSDLTISVNVSVNNIGMPEYLWGI